MTKVVHLIAEDLVVGQKPPRKRAPRKASIRTMIKQAEKAGKTVTSIMTPDGTMIAFDAPEKENTKNPWDEVLDHGPH
jgi:hypothetical protein